MTDRLKRAPCLSLALLVASALGACAAAPDIAFQDLVHRGDFGRARMHLAGTMSRDRGDRDYLLDRLEMGIVSLADGVPKYGEPAFEEVYDLLRTQGLNADKTVPSVVLNEDLKLWKGEPFEQAMAYAYIALANATIGEWGNARAAAENSLFHLRDFRRDDTDDPHAEELIRRAVDDEQYLDHGYVAAESNFALGCLLAAIANQQLGRRDEAADYFHRAAAINEHLAGLVDRFREGEYNTVLVVEFGRGPMKVGVGPDQAIAQFMPQTPSDDAPLEVRVAGAMHEVPVACDLNSMARDHMWNNLEDIRKAKSLIGQLLVFGGAAAAIHGVDTENDDMALAGLGMILAGAFARAGAHADTRHCEVLPQRVYVVPVTVSEGFEPIELLVRGQPVSKMALTALAPPAPGAVQLRLVRLVSTGFSPPTWAVSGRIVHESDASALNAGADEGPAAIPYILGGLNVRSPSYESLRSMPQAGFPRGLSLTALEDFYREEGIRIVRDDDPADYPGLHVLEGGDCLFTPLRGSTGFLRLFAQQHPPYRARSDAVRGFLAAEVQPRAEAPVGAAAPP